MIAFVHAHPIEEQPSENRDLSGILTNIPDDLKSDENLFKIYEIINEIKNKFVRWK